MKFLLTLLFCASCLAAPIGFNQPQIPGLVGWWSLNEGSGTNYTDYANGITGSHTNSTRTNGIISGGVYFTNTVQKITCGTGSPLGSTSQFTVCAWFYPQKTSRSDIVGVWLNGTGVDQFLLTFGLAGASKPSCYVNRGGAVSSATGPTTLANNTWGFIVGTWDGSAIRCYLNGVLQGATTNAGTLGSGINRPIVIGNNNNNDGPSVGMIDDVRIYNRALSAEEIKQLYGGGYGSHQ